MLDLLVTTIIRGHREVGAGEAGRVRLDHDLAVLVLDVHLRGRSQPTGSSASKVELNTTAVVLTTQYMYSVCWVACG